VKLYLFKTSVSLYDLSAELEQKLTITSLSLQREITAAESTPSEGCDVTWNTYSEVMYGITECSGS
jgi:hypothetical protein